MEYTDLDRVEIEMLAIWAKLPADQQADLLVQIKRLADCDETAPDQA